MERSLRATFLKRNFKCTALDKVRRVWFQNKEWAGTCAAASPVRFLHRGFFPPNRGGLSAPIVSTVQVPRTVISMSRQSAFFQPLTSPSSINRLEYLPQKRCLADEVKKPTLEQEIRSQALLRFGCCCAECAEHSEQTYEAIKQKDTRIDRQFYDRCPLSPLVSTTGLICASTSKKTGVPLAASVPIWTDVWQFALCGLFADAWTVVCVSSGVRQPDWKRVGLVG